MRRMPSEAESSPAQSQRLARTAISVLWEGLKSSARYAFSRGAWYAAGKAWRAMRLLFMLRGHIALQKLLSHPQFRTLIREQPLLPVKYLVPYVARGLSTRTRRSILFAHYQFIQRVFRPEFLDCVMRSLPLWLATIDAHAFLISLDFPYSNQEGDLQLVFKMDAAEVYRLIFVFAPGKDFNMADDIVIAISNIQGAQEFDRVKLATKRCSDIQPAHILMAALGGLAQATNISSLLGFHGDRQISRSAKLFFSYEKFYANYGEEVLGEKMHRARLPFFERPVSDIQSNHRKRSLRKRQFKVEIRTQVNNAVAQYFTEAEQPARQYPPKHRARPALVTGRAESRLKLQSVVKRIARLAAQVPPLRIAVIAYCELRPLGPGHARWNRRHPFDRAHGVRTSRVLPGFLLKPDDPVDSPTIAYVPAQPSVVRSALATIPDPEQCHFLDIGCGKGGPLLIAAEFDFWAITGIELSPTLAWIARRNAAIYARAYPQRSRIDIVTGDALDYKLPDQKLVVFLYHPFERSLMARLLANIEASLRESARDIYIVYYNPVCADVFDGSTNLERRYAAQLSYDPEEVAYGHPGEADTVVIWKGRGNPHPGPRGMEDGARHGKNRKSTHSRVR
jgi:uncharacterized protein